MIAQLQQSLKELDTANRQHEKVSNICQWIAQYTITRIVWEPVMQYYCEQVPVVIDNEWY